VLDQVLSVSNLVLLVHNDSRGGGLVCQAHTRCIAQQALSFSLTHTHTHTQTLWRARGVAWLAVGACGGSTDALSGATGALGEQPGAPRAQRLET